MGKRKTARSWLFVTLSFLFLAVSGKALAENWNQHLVRSLQYYQGNQAKICIRTGEVQEGGTVTLLEICPTDNIPRKVLGTFQPGGEQLSDTAGSHLLFFSDEQPVWIIKKDKYPVPLVYQDKLDIYEVGRLYKTATGNSLQNVAPEWLSRPGSSGFLVDSFSRGVKVIGLEALALIVGRTAVALTMGPVHDYRGWDAIWEGSFLNNEPLKNIVTMPVIENLAFRYFLQGKISQWLQLGNLWLGSNLPVARRRAAFQSRLAGVFARGYLAYCLASENTTGTYLALQGMYQVLMSSTLLWSAYDEHGLAGSYISTVVAAVLREIIAFSAHRFFGPGN